ncbi:hypothetical protein [Pediococcus pentosaceus]|uniref:hypothetical protein n=1 Tax=Pediococcus pentosaceus TaxID=1255 RepID=UPI001051E69E|nr:hypothetical protein [Pediococcus pentosaceus]
MRTKELKYHGELYSSYYQLEKVMDIPRRTIQYRHETKHIPLDEVPDFVPDPLVKRFGEKTYHPKKLNNQTELEKIIEYPKAPDWYLGDDKKRESESRDKYINWLEKAPETLLKREIRIYENELQVLVDRENSKYFYATNLHESEKQTLEKRIEIQKNVLNKREINE